MATIPMAYVENFARLVNVISDDMRSRLAADLARVNLSDVAAARDAVIELLQLYCGGYTDYAAVIASQFYDGLAEQMTGAPAHAVAASLYEPAAIDGSVRAIMQDVVEGKPREVWEQKIIDRADKEVRNAADSCIALNADRDGVRWARVPTGAVNCPFCIMLASRGAVYHKPELAAAGHANCDCRVVPDFGDGIEGYDRDLYLDMWVHPEDYPELREARNARRRELYAREHGKSTEPLAASFNFMNRNDELYERMNKIEPVEGFSDYALHSDGFDFDRLSGKSSQPVDVFTLAAWIRADKNYDGGNIRLLACSAGKYDNGAAQILADLLGVTVRAPEEELFVYDDGYYNIARDDEESKAILLGEAEQVFGWRDFVPGGGAYNDQDDQVQGKD